MSRILWNDIKARVTGISLPFGGVEWTPDPDERKVAEEAITYIENRGIFYAPFEWEHPKDTYLSASTARDDITALMQKLWRETGVYKKLFTIRGALRDFQRRLETLHLKETSSKTDMTNQEVADYDAALIKLRKVSGAEIADIAIAYKLNVSTELDFWLRPLADT